MKAKVKIEQRKRSVVEKKVPILSAVFDKDTLFMRVDAGKAINPKTGVEYELAVNVGGSLPIVRSGKTKKWFTVTWQAMVDAAIEAGIDEE